MLYFLDDAAARAFEPFALTRPGCELRAGALLVRERWQRALGMEAAGFIGAAHLKDFDEPGAARAAGGRIPKGSVIVNARCAPALIPTRAADIWRCDGRVAAVTVSRDVDADEVATTALESLAGGAGEASVAGWWIEHVWDLIRHLAPMLAADIAVLSRDARRHEDKRMVAGSPGVFVDKDASVEPQVFFDTTGGPVLVRRGAVVMAFTRVVGPCVIGEESQVGGDKIAGSSIGNVCKVHGELSSSVFTGHSNKGHDGFVGHSYLGRWVNLGAGTITSNLKNTYGAVQLWTPGGERDTGMQFLGTLFGDHVKTGIGTSLNTGTVLGAGANIYGSVMPPKAVPPFAWGDQPPYAPYRLDKFLDVARRVMERRHVALSDSQARQLAAAFEGRWTVGESQRPARGGTQKSGSSKGGPS